jgi:hypothetical protein
MAGRITAMAIRATIVAMLLACESAPAATPLQPKPDATKLPQGTATQDQPQATVTGGQGMESASPCVDKELQKRGLDKYGGDQGTMYPGGTPLFHEASGKSLDRAQYVYSHHPDIAKACGASGAGP